jgi:hypothetical protein
MEWENKVVVDDILPKKQLEDLKRIIVIKSVSLAFLQMPLANLAGSRRDSHHIDFRKNNI